MIKTAGIAFAALTMMSMSAHAADKYVFDASHSQIVFSYEHLGFSTTYGMYSGFDGEAMLDLENPQNSSVTASFETKSLITGWDKRTSHFLSADFFNAEQHPTVTFTSNNVEMTGEKTAKISGDLSVNGKTLPVTLDATLNKVGDHPMAGKAWAGFDAETTLLRSEFGLGKFAPFISDEVKLMLSVELMKAE